MHLFALLITASFATQFVAPSDNAGLTVLPAKIFSAHTIIPELKLTPETPPSPTTNPLYYRLSADGGSTYPVTGSTTDVTTGTWTVEDLDISALGALTTATTITVETSIDDNDWAAAETDTIAVTEPAFVVTKAEYKLSDITAWDGKIPLTGFALSADTYYTFVVSNSIDIDPTAVGDEISVVAEVLAAGTVTIDIAAAKADLTLTLGSKFYVFAAEGDDAAAAAAAVALAPVMISIIPNTFTLTVFPDRLTTLHTAVKKLKVTASDNTQWPDTIHYRLTHAGASGEKVEGELDVVTGTKDYVAEDVDLTDILPLTDANDVLLEISLDGKKNWLATTKTLDVKGTAAHTLTTATLTDTKFAAITGIEVNIGENAEKDIYVVVSASLDIEDTATAIVKNGKTAAASGKFTAAITADELATLPKTHGSKIYVFATVESTPTAAKAIALAPAVLTITKTDYELTMDPTSISSALPSIAALKVTVSPKTEWISPVDFVITKDNSDAKVEGTMTNADIPNTAIWTAAGAVDLTPLGSLTGIAALTVKFSLNGKKSWLVSTGSITVTAPAHSVEPSLVPVNELAGFTSIKVTLTEASVTAPIHVIVTKTYGVLIADAEVNKATAAAVSSAATLALDADDLTKLGDLTASTVLYVYASKTSAADALTKAPATINFRAATTFTFPATTAVWAKDLKIPDIVVTPTPAGIWPASLSGKVFCKYTVKAAESNVPVDKIEVPLTEDAGVWTIPETVINTFELKNGDHTINVEISETNKASYLPSVAAHKVEITEKPVGDADFTVTPAKIELPATTASIEVTRKSTAADPWVADVKFFFSTDPFAEEPADATKLVAATEVTAGAKYSYALTLASITPALADGDILYVFVKHSIPTSAGSNAATWLPIPAGIPVEAGGTPEADFTVDPTGINLKKDGKTVTITVEEKTTPSNAAWAEEVYLYFSKSDKETEKAATAMTVTKKSATGAKYSADLTLSTITPALKKDEKLYVYVRHSVDKKAESNSPTGEWLAVPAAITISAAGRAAPLFSLLAVVLFCLVKLF